MKPSFWLTIYMYKQHIKNQPKSNIWNTVKFEEQILHYFYAGQKVNIHTFPIWRYFLRRWRGWSPVSCLITWVQLTFYPTCSPPIVLTTRRKQQCWRFWETFSVQWTVEISLLWHSSTCLLRSIPSIMWHCCSDCGFRTVSAAVYTTGSSPISAVGFSLSAVVEARRLQLSCYVESHKDRSLDRFCFCYTRQICFNWFVYMAWNPTSTLMTLRSTVSAIPHLVWNFRTVFLFVSPM